MIVPGIVIQNGWWVGGNTKGGSVNPIMGTHPKPARPSTSVVSPTPVATTVTDDGSTEGASDLKWWQRRPADQRKANRERMAKESASAALTAGSIAWLIVGPSKWSKVFNIIMMITPTVGSSEDQQSGQSRYYDSDPQGA